MDRIRYSSFETLHFVKRGFVYVTGTVRLSVCEYGSGTLGSFITLRSRGREGGREGGSKSKAGI